MTTDRFVHVPYLVKAGDTLSEIAFRFLGRVDRCMELAKLNEIQYPGTIQAGATIMIPVPIGPDMLEHPAVVEAMKPERASYPATYQGARVIAQRVIDGYRPCWDRDTDPPNEARAMGAITLAQALGIFDADEAEHEMNQIAARFHG